MVDTSPSPSEISSIEIPASFFKFAESVLVRLSSLYPQIEFTLADNMIEFGSVETFNVDEIRQEVMQLLYREKILAETMEIRTKILS